MIKLTALFLLLLTINESINATFTIRPRSHVVQSPKTIVFESKPLTINLDVHHSMQPIQSTSQANNRSRVAMNQAQANALSNMTGCGSIDFSGLVAIDAANNPNNVFRLIMDSGSTTIAVVSNICTTCDYATPVWTPTQGPVTSPSAPDGIRAESLYGGGTGWSGKVYRASVAVGNSLAVQTNIATIDVSNDFINGKKICAVNQNARTQLNTSQGIFGLAYKAIAVDGTDSWIANYIAATGIKQEFTIQMCPTGGNLWIGAFDTSFIGSSFTYVPILYENWFSVAMTQIRVTTQSSSGVTMSSASIGSTINDFGPCSSHGHDCSIIDSGTTQILLPPTPFNQLLTKLRADSYYQSIFVTAGRQDVLSSGMCQDAEAALMPSMSQLNARLPKLLFTFASDAAGNNPVTISINAIPGYLSLNFDDTGRSYYCRGVSMLGAGSPSILGFGFMNQFTVRHDLPNKRLGFATTSNCGFAAQPMPSYQWITSPLWSDCSAQCGGGIQWRQVVCADAYNTSAPNIQCATTMAGTMPSQSRACNTQACSSSPAIITVANIRLNGLSTSQTINQGSSNTITYQSNSSVNQTIVLFLQPQSNTQSSLPVYISRNASVNSISNSDSFIWTVPSTTQPGNYRITAKKSSNQSTFVANFTVTIVAQSITDSCSSPSICNNRGACSITPSNTAQCTCVADYSGAQCQTAPLSGCLIACLNGGTATSSCTCACPNGFSGVLCEQSSIVSNVTINHAISSFNAADLIVFKHSAVTDLAFVMGLSENSITINSLVSDPQSNSRCILTFTATSSSSKSALTVAINQFNAQLNQQSNNQPTSLNAGILSAYFLSLSTSAPSEEDPEPPQSDHLAWIEENYMIIAGVIGGVALAIVLLVFYKCCCGRSEPTQVAAHPMTPKAINVQQKHEAQHDYGY